VIGVGGAGGNAIANMINAEIEGVEFVVANTDAQALNNSIAKNRIQLGLEITKGLGAGARPESVAPRRKRPSPRSSARSKACTCASSRPVWAAARYGRGAGHRQGGA
jgi:hypothetical protein